MAPSQRPAQPAERLEVPTLPPPSSRFVLPPPPSDLLNRLQAFLPQIRDANAQLSASDDAAAPGEEAVALEEITDSSDEDSEEDSSDSSSDSGNDSDEEEDAEGQGAVIQNGLAAPDSDGDAPAARPSSDDPPRGTLAHLMDISASPSLPPTRKNKPLVQEESAVVVQEDDMQAD